MMLVKKHAVTMDEQALRRALARIATRDREKNEPQESELRVTA